MSADAARTRLTARYVGRLVGLAGAVFSLLAVFVMAAAARENQTAILAMQQSLVNGGDPLLLIGGLLPVFVATYASALLTCLISLGLAWYAGRVTAAQTRHGGGSTAGLWVMLVSGAVWLVAALLAIIVFAADGTISWLLATVLYALVAPASNVSGAISSHPAPAYLGMQLVLFLVQAVAGAGAALGLGALAGGLGALSVAPDSPAPPTHPGPWTEQFAPR
jgi:hypothetical protein